jgi:ATP/maltotriose-dependent transcriptional regulator MalT
MPDEVVIREAEGRAAADFLTSARERPAALFVEGEPGIGKTTLCSAVVHDAGEVGFRVLSARPAAAESVLSYASVADLLHGVDAASFAKLPYPQRHAVDRVMLRADADDKPTDQRAVAAAFLSVVETLAAESPVLVAIDDLQWLDPSSARAVAFATRRLSGPVGVLATKRDGRRDGTWLLQLPDADDVTRIRLHPLAVGALHVAVTQRLGRSLPRPTMVRIHEISGGNPLYALELARAVVAGTTQIASSLPSTLAELVRDRIGSLDGDVHDVLLAAACTPVSTVEVLAGVMGTAAADVVRLLEAAERMGIVEFDGNKALFSHPLLAWGVYADANPALRRETHRRLAQVVTEPEPAARHLALAATTGDPATLRSLDEAAEIARTRGAPAAAAELVELAMRLGGDTPQRQMCLAAHLFDAGDSRRAATLLGQTIDQLAPGMLRAEALSQLAVMRLFDNSSLEAAELLQRALDEAEGNLTVQVQALVPLSYALGETGRFGAAVDAVENAVLLAEQLGRPDLLTQALGVRVMLHFMRGDGIDESSLRRALELEDRHMSVPMAFRPSMHNAMLLAWTGQLERAHDEMRHIRRQCLERGEESDLIYVTFHAVLIAIWRGDLTEATLLSDDAVERAMQLGGDVSLFVALTVRAAAAAYGGREDDARRDLAGAVAASRRCGSYRLAEWPVTILGFLEVSLGNHREALTTLEPLLSHLDPASEQTEVVAASFVPDAVEAMIQVGRLTDAKPLVDALERNGRRLDRAWMLAVGARCRAMLLAAHGDLTAAASTAAAAMEHHDLLPMPLERARTQLLVGQLQRRQRLKAAASETLGEALAAFEDMGIPLWAERVRVELARCTAVPRRPSELSPVERRVATLAAQGMTNRDVATELFISAKTVEANLARVYRKLGIHSRAELGRHMSQAIEHEDT